MQTLACNTVSGLRAFRSSANLPERLNAVSRFQSDGGSGKKLLLLSDFFGAPIAGWFSQYFTEVWHLNISYLMNFSTNEVDRVTLSKAIFLDYAPDCIIYLFHDGAVLSWPHELVKQLAMDIITTVPKVAVTFAVEPSAQLLAARRLSQMSHLV